MATRSEPVVVGIDGAVRSLPAVRWAAHEAAATGRELRLVHAAAPAVVLASGRPVDPCPPGRPDVARIATRAMFDEAAAVARATAPEVRIDERATAGMPVPVLLDAARRAYLVVLGPHAASLSSDLTLGSVSAELLARAPCPVAVVRAGQRGHALVEPPGPVVVGVDGSADSAAAADFAAELAERHAVPLRLVTAWRMSRIPGSGTRTQQREPQEHILAAIRTDVLRRHPRLDAQAELAEGSPADVLVRQSLRARLLVVGCRGHGAAVGLLLGSVSQTIARTAYCPVAVHHRPAAPPAPAGAANPV
ncbi:universal stress protein [Gandjariella thermophila]|uniref:universal stress protein n=1 Tax=Gandjariella thermophila TaxID=1931992 RepID=UPI001864EBDE|nr:universal stress protein [Gandjariella thermophila]